jgi:flagellar hook-associated protein 3 FlgL
MRVTNGMMSSTVVFNTQRALQRFVDLQTQMSSGRRINKPSDDPSGTLRDLGYRTEIADIEQYQKNINRAQSWVKTYDDLMADMKDVMSSVKEIAISMSNGNFDAVARNGSATEVESAIDHFLQLGNSRLENRYVLAGNLTQTQPFNRSANGFVYAGDFGQIEYEVSGKLRQAVNTPGSDLLLKPLVTLGRDADLNNAVTPATLLANLNDGRGVGQSPATFVVTDQNLNINVTVDLTGAVTVADALAAINAQLTAGGITNATASISPTGNAIKIDTTPNGLVNGTTLVSKINSGNGADLIPGKIKVSDGAAVDIEVDLNGSVTLNDITTKFNTALTNAGVSNVVMSIDPSGTALQVTDSNGVPLGLSISELFNTETTATDLGIVGAISPTLTGRALSPEVLFNIAETTGTVARDLGIFGSFTADLIGSDIDPRLTLTTNVSDLQNGLGGGLGPIALTHGGTVVTLDLSDPTIVTVQDLLDTFNNSGLNITASINSSGRGIQIVNNDSTRSFTIEESGGRTAKNLGIYGSSDMMGTLFVLTNALRNDDQEGAGLLLGHLDASIQHLIDSRAEIGSRGARLNTLSSRQDDQKLTATKRLSEIEDSDIAELVSQLATHESSYQAALAAAAKIIQPTLMDFLKL